MGGGGERLSTTTTASATASDNEASDNLRVESRPQLTRHITDAVGMRGWEAAEGWIKMICCN